MRGLHCEQRVQDLMMAGMEGGELSAASGGCLWTGKGLLPSCGGHTQPRSSASASHCPSIWPVGVVAGNGLSSSVPLGRGGLCATCTRCKGACCAHHRIQQARFPPAKPTLTHTAHTHTHAHAAHTHMHTQHTHTRTRTHTHTRTRTHAQAYTGMHPTCGFRPSSSCAPSRFLAAACAAAAAAAWAVPKCA